jgi:hypothetical protein
VSYTVTLTPLFTECQRDFARDSRALADLSAPLTSWPAGRSATRGWRPMSTKGALAAASGSSAMLATGGTG